MSIKDELTICRYNGNVINLVPINTGMKMSD